MTTTPAPSFGLIIIGDEILSGRRADKHLPKVIELLQARGLSLAWALCVGDERPRITAALRDAFASGDAVFSCGGIGATPDDHTRQCAGAALDRDLALHPTAQQRIEQRMRDTALEKGETFDAERPDNVHRYNMGVFPVGARIIENPYNKIPGFTCDSPSGVGAVHFVPGFPVMAWPMIEAVLDGEYKAWHRINTWEERSVVVMGAMEASLTPLMEQIEHEHAVKVFSLPSVDHPQYGRHIELGVKGEPQAVAPAYAQLMAGLQTFGAEIGPETVR
ncbi:MAG: molybdopterin-binding protein [Hydrogenophaga sp.]